MGKVSYLDSENFKSILNLLHTIYVTLNESLNFYGFFIFLKQSIGKR